MGADTQVRTLQSSMQMCFEPVHVGNRTVLQTVRSNVVFTAESTLNDAEKQGASTSSQAQ